MEEEMSDIADEFNDLIRRTENLLKKGDKPCWKHIVPVPFCFECYEENNEYKKSQ